MSSTGVRLPIGPLREALRPLTQTHPRPQAREPALPDKGPRLQPDPRRLWHRQDARPPGRGPHHHGRLLRLRRPRGHAEARPRQARGHVVPGRHHLHASLRLLALPLRDAAGPHRGVHQHPRRLPRALLEGRQRRRQGLHPQHAAGERRFAGHKRGTAAPSLPLFSLSTPSKILQETKH